MHNTCRRIMSGNDKTPSHCINSVYSLNLILKHNSSLNVDLISLMSSSEAGTKQNTFVTQVLLPYHYNVLFTCFTVVKLL